ncbi:dolichyl-diphosphooligosaccharide--protein glycosyltransferase 48 kda subunit precursor [Naematelia encephala]|uniref:Dolichyl-diphosphooligosaccharide--protein glycosyltransferase subunit WBP1 n=1 Tax=Naematelia encephala TaxID=71784 RepID=A0A1Y2AJG9_9TREE|nr:dolichyl-diphosphooligosaccharide--protein glycosyltransferase 48 kda subunit precursor [Naematelia encephala]
MRYPACLIAMALTLLGCAAARSATGDRVLVVLEPQVVKDEYSRFWSSLSDRGFELTFKGPKDDSAELVRYGEPQYDHLIMFAPAAKSFAAPLSPQSILSAQIAGLNTLYLLSPNISEINRDTFREYDLEFVERDSMLLDAFSHPTSATPATVLLPAASCAVSNGPLLSSKTLSGGPIVYPSGTVHSTGPNPYLIEVLHAPSTSYVGENRVLDADEVEVEASLTGKAAKEAVLTGKRASLVTAMQTRDNVRIGFVGSGDVFKDEWWGKTVKTADGTSHTAGNADFVSDFTKWVFQETGVIKVVSTTHHKIDESEPKEMYRIKDDITYSLVISQHATSENGSSAWSPVWLSDVQLDFTMLDPHIRTALPLISSDKTTSTYSTSFQAPDRHGVFKFVVEYWRPGWSYIRTSSTASVVPFRHDEYPRFIRGAWPFYSSTISVSVAFLLFCGLWVMLGEGRSKGKKKAE